MLTTSRKPDTGSAERSIFERDLASCIDALTKFNISKRAVVEEVLRTVPSPHLPGLAQSMPLPLDNAPDHNNTTSPSLKANPRPLRVSSQIEPPQPVLLHHMDIAGA